MPVSERIDFPGTDGQTLAARIDRPSGRPRAWALFAHCFSCSKDIKAAQRIAQQLAARGIGVLRFDFTGLGRSEGDFANTNFSTNIADLHAAADWLSKTHGGPQLMIGHSLGGAAVIVAAGDLPGVRAVATIGAPADAEHVLHTFASDLDRIATDGEAEVSLAGRPFRIRQQFVDDVRGAKVRDAAAALKRPLLVMHAPLDEIVGIDNATGLFIAARHPKSFVSLDDADHLLTREADGLRTADLIATWAMPYLADAEIFEETEAAPQDRSVLVSETGRGPYQNDITIGEHHLVADEPASIGGDDTGPDPYQLVAAALGACTNMTLRMYANRKGWPLSSVSVRVSHAKDHASDCEQCEEGRKVDIFERDLRISGPLDEDQRAKLVEIADKCPVHRTLHEPVVVRTRLVD